MPNLPSEPVDRLSRVADALGLPATGRTAERLGGGRGNEVYKVAAGGRPVVVRLAPLADPVGDVDWDAVPRNTRIAAVSGSGPPVVADLPEVAALVVEWVEGRALTAADLRDQATLARLAGVVRRLHTGPPFVTDLDVFSVQQRYLTTLRDRGLPLPAGAEDLEAACETVRRALAEQPEPTVPGHNDLIPSNVLDDGRRMWLVDFEYAANSDPCFDLGNLWASADLPAGHLELLVTTRFGRPSRRRVARARLLGAVAAYTWAVWAAVQHSYRPVPYDYLALAAAETATARAGLTGPGLDSLLDEAGGPD